MSVKISEEITISAGKIGKWFFYGFLSTMVILNIRGIAGAALAIV